MFKNSKKGFTLAEVLITLAVIGVVAAMSIPALMGSTNNAELKTGLKKAVSVLNQAVTMSVAMDNTDAQSYTGGGTTNIATGAKAMRDWLATRLNVLSTGGNATKPYLITADGMIFTFDPGYSAGGVCGASSSVVKGTANCGVIVDVNGAKKPNTESTGGVIKDQFFLVFKKSSVVPGQSPDNTDTTVQDALTK